MESVFKEAFWADFTIADVFGEKSIQETFDRAFKEWSDNVVQMTKLTIVLNHKIWQWAEKDEPRARLYDKLWRYADSYCMENFTGEDLSYFLNETD